MSIKAGRVGVAPDQVDEFGNISSEATSGYTKQEADAKFETQSSASTEYGKLQPKTLEVPIHMLVGSALVSKTTAESIFETMDGGRSVKELTDLTTVIDDELTSNFTLDNSHVYKIGNLIVLICRVTGVTVNAWGTIASVPSGYAPKSDFKTVAYVGGGNAQYACLVQVNTSGNISTNLSLDNGSVTFGAVWVV